MTSHIIWCFSYRSDAPGLYASVAGFSGTNFVTVAASIARSARLVEQTNNRLPPELRVTSDMYHPAPWNLERTS